VSVEVHGVQISGPVMASSMSIAKFLAAERAHAVLVDESSASCLKKLCDCSLAMAVDGEGQSVGDKRQGVSNELEIVKVVEQEEKKDEEEEEKPMDMDQGND
jgi:hypothetical protein